jgi:heterodisulfide reductase subunit A-like polyferredoxin
MADLGIANVIARSAFVNEVDEALCLGCGDCLAYCQFDALTLADVVEVHSSRCVGCGVCVPACPEEALGLARRPAEQILPTPVTEPDWLAERATIRGLDLDQVL